MYHTFFVLLFIDWHLILFTIYCELFINKCVYIFVIGWLEISWMYPRNGNWTNCMVSIFGCWGNFTLISTVTVPVFIPTVGIWWTFFPQVLIKFVVICFLDESHWWWLISSLKQTSTFLSLMPKHSGHFLKYLQVIWIFLWELFIQFFNLLLIRRFVGGFYVWEFYIDCVSVRCIIGKYSLSPDSSLW